MKCPKCKTEIEYVRVYSQCYQNAYFKEGTNKIEDYHSVEEILETLAIECPECDEDIINEVEE